jgi:cyclic 2,3-diphosphoglycerate synthetase
MCEDFLVSSEKLRKLIDGVHAINPEVKVVKTIFRPRPLDDLSGKKVFLASTAPPGALELKAEHLETAYGAKVVASSPHLADRDRLVSDLESAREADVLVTELKAAGVDTVSVYAEKNDKELVYLENVPVALEGNLEDEIDGLEALARRRRESR